MIQDTRRLSRRPKSAAAVLWALLLCSAPHARAQDDDETNDVLARVLGKG